MGEGTAVLLKFQQPSWLDCIEMLRAAGVDVYVTINGRKGNLSNMRGYFADIAGEIAAAYGDSVNGIYIRNPGRKGFTFDWYEQVFDDLNESGFKVGIEGYGNKWNLAVARQVQLVVTFKDDLKFPKFIQLIFNPSPNIL